MALHNYINYAGALAEAHQELDPASTVAGVRGQLGSGSESVIADA